MTSPESGKPFETLAELEWALQEISQTAYSRDLELRVCATARLAFAHAPSEGRLRDALQEIAKGEGAFAFDPLMHAENCIESMKRIAANALAALPLPVSDQGARKVEIQDALDLLRELEEGNEAEMVEACNGFLESFAARRHKEAP